MKRLRNIFPLLLVIGLTALSGVVSGALSNRWGPPAGAELSAARLADIPEEFGDWQLLSAADTEPEIIEMLQCSGSLQRVYRHRETGQQVSVVLFLGPPGPISAHTPEICFSTHDYTQLGAPHRERVRGPIPSSCAGVPPAHGDEPAADVWRLKFRSNTLRAETLSVAYAWNTGRGWQAPNSPRFTFAGQPLLYKIQLSSVIDTSLSTAAGDPCESFLKAFLPIADAALFNN